jgi:hypothetical protein
MTIEAGTADAGGESQGVPESNAGQGNASESRGSDARASRNAPPVFHPACGFALPADWITLGEPCVRFDPRPGPRASSEPPSAAICLIKLELVYAKFSPVTMNTVSMPATWRFVIASWHSLARSVMLRIPRTIAQAFTDFA